MSLSFEGDVAAADDLRSAFSPALKSLPPIFHLLAKA